jgi:WD40 repeat protein
MKNIRMHFSVLIWSMASTVIAHEPPPEHAIGRLGSTRMRHGGIATTVAFADGGKTVVSAGTDGAIRVWDASNGLERRALRPTGLKLEADAGDPSGLRVFQAHLSADGTRAVGIGYRDGKMRIWNVADGKVIREQRNGVRMPAGLPEMDLCALSPDGKWVAELSRPSNDKTQVRLVATESGKSTLPVIVNRVSPKNFLMFSADSKVLAWCKTEQEGRDEIQFIDVETGKALLNTRGSGHSTIACAAFTPDHKKLICGGPSGLCTIEVSSGKIGSPFLTKLDVLDLAMHPNGLEAVALVSPNADLRVIDLQTRKVTRRFGSRHRSEAGQLLLADGISTAMLAFSSDGSRFAVAGQDATIRLYDYAAGKEIFPPGDHTSAIRVLQFSDDGKTLMTGAEEGSIQFWDLGASLRRSNSRFPIEEGGCVATSKDMRWLAFSTEEAIEIRSLPDNKRFHRIPFQANENCDGLAFTPDGKLAIFEQVQGTKVQLFDVAAKKELRSFMLPEDVDVHEALVMGGLFSPCGRWMTVNTMDSAISLLDLATGKPWRDIALSPEEIPFGFSYSPDGRSMLIRCGSSHLVIYEVATGRERRVIGKPNPQDDDVEFDILSALSTELWQNTAALAISADGRLLAHANIDGSIGLWEVASGSRLAAFRGHRNFVTCLAFAPDGKTLVSGGDDSGIVIWSLAKFLPRGADASAFTRDHFQEHWKKLLSSDSETAFVAIENLSQAHVIPWIREELQKPRPKLDETQVHQWLDDLGSARFAVREKATLELTRLGEDAFPMLQSALDRSPNAEATRRIKELIEKSGPNNLRDEKLRQWRALEVIERIGTPEAKALLQQLANGASERLITREAKLALKRIMVR